MYAADVYAVYIYYTMYLLHVYAVYIEYTTYTIYRIRVVSNLCIRSWRFFKTWQSSGFHTLVTTRYIWHFGVYLSSTHVPDFTNLHKFLTSQHICKSFNTFPRVQRNCMILTTVSNCVTCWQVCPNFAKCCKSARSSRCWKFGQIWQMD